MLKFPSSIWTSGEGGGVTPFSIELSFVSTDAHISVNEFTKKRVVAGKSRHVWLVAGKSPLLWALVIEKYHSQFRHGRRPTSHRHQYRQGHRRGKMSEAVPGLFGRVSVLVCGEYHCEVMTETG